MEQLPPPQEKELPAPNEKLLRSPTFWERQGKTAKWLAISSIILFVFIFTLALLIKSQKSTTVPIQPTQPPISTAPTINTIEISADKKECKEKFLLWCSNCQSNNWQGVLNSEINVCLSDSLDIHLPKSATCESSKKDCCLVISEGKRTQYYKCLEDIDKTDFKSEEKVAITIDKTKYEQEGVINITVRNNSTQSIWYNGPPNKCENAFSIGVKEENELPRSRAARYPFFTSPFKVNPQT